MNLDDALGKDFGAIQPYKKTMHAIMLEIDISLAHRCDHQGAQGFTFSFPVKCDMAIEAGRFGFGQIKKAVLEANNLWKGILMYRSGHVHGNSLEAIYKDQMPKRIQNRSVIKP